MEKNLIEEFFKNKSTSKDQSIYDEKHKKIIQNVNLEKDISKFRNWELQNDMGLKYKLGFIPKLFLNHYKLKVITPVIELFNKRINHYFELSSMLDDIEILRINNGEKFLAENPQNKTPGSIDFPKVNGFSVSARWLRYVYFLSQINNHKLLTKSSIWLDVGSFYGGLQGLVKKYYPKTKIIMVDFEHQLARSYIYLKTLYPNTNHVLPSKIKDLKNFNSLPDGSIVYIDQKDFEYIKEFNVDLFSNFFSLGEMKKETFKNYLDSKLYRNSETIYMANRFSSSPYFDKTYDDNINIFDYKDERSIKHFDVLPINHYQIGYRDLFNRKFFRNTSSPYFEIILKKQ
jgi:putative sugar O-methyltransferase